MNSRLLVMVLSAFVLTSCGKTAIPKRAYHEGWEQLNTQRLKWPDSCYLHWRPELFQDSLELKRCGCYKGFASVDFDHWNVLMYSVRYYNITDLKVGAYVYINHDIKKVRLEIVDRVSPNRSGLTTNGYSEVARHNLVIPNVPLGYEIELTRR